MDLSDIRSSPNPWPASPLSPSHQSSPQPSQSPFPDQKDVPRSSASQPSPSLSQKRNLTDIVSDKFPEFDHRSVVVNPFDEEAKRDTEFHQKLNEMLLDLMMEFHAWSTARPAQEANQAAETLEREIKAIMDLEKEQGRSSLQSSSVAFFGRPLFRSHVPLSYFILGVVLTCH
ncbi:hypothetical protein JAAARDRAFT_128837 [Jaapia argillacea MUCL 33604]|uniref:Uncharacterized protein n=1 Tax=Jaapia argillacea MUCL 33604 TaxID=933084 RepID=A0A067PX63_9AGAM|nr:hypothetical protein JAAARDRAFT_128837 [Jaapia argillacea MUCL 33604]